MTAVTCAVLLVAVAVHAWCLQVIPERTRIVTWNDKYVADLKFYVNRYGRKSKYYIQLEGTIKHVWANNVSVHLIFYEYLHNEYKRSFVEMHFKFCDMVNKDPYVGQAIATTGVTCPAVAGHYKLNNITIPTENFPNVWPFERCKVDIKVHQLPTEDLMFNVELYVLFKQTNH